MLVSLCTDHAFVSPGATGFVAVWMKGEEPVVLDAYAEVPGRGLTDSTLPQGRLVGKPPGMATLVGYETVATPGGFAGLARAIEQAGRLSWAQVVEPAIAHAEQGVEMTAAGEEYFRDLGDQVFGWHPESRRLLAQPHGRPVVAGDAVHLEGLADTLRQIAREGVQTLYGGALGRQISADVLANGGRLTLDDLRAYEVIAREAIRVPVGGWTVAVGPPPAVGGVTLAAMLLAMADPPIREWGPTERRRFVEAQRRVLTYRRDHLHGNDDGDAAFELLRSLGWERPSLPTSPSTVHASAVDTEGHACAITMSDGYGSGVIVPGTGFGLNNALGELELGGPTVSPTPGTRLASNMAPTIARHPDGSVLAIGSPGAARITTTLAQVLVQHLEQGLDLQQAVREPRLHLDVTGEQPVLMLEEGAVVMDLTDLVEHRGGYDMYFGSAQAALWRPGAGLSGTVDPRRDGFYVQGGGEDPEHGTL